MVSMASYNYASILFIFFLLSLLIGDRYQSDMMQLTQQIAEKVGNIEIKLDEIKKELNEFKKENTKKDDGKIELDDLNEQIDGIDDWNNKYKWNATTYKWNASDCSNNLIIYEDGLTVKYDYTYSKWSSVRATLPISTYNFASKKPSIAFFYEVEILVDHSSTSSNYAGIFIGFCVQEFPLELEYKSLGLEDSIGIWGKEIICIDGNNIRIGKDKGLFKKRDFVGIGIIHQPNWKMECFVTLNGKLLGKAELPTNFGIDFNLFPAVTLKNKGNLIRANFGKKEFRFKDFGNILVGKR